MKVVRLGDVIVERANLRATLRQVLNRLKCSSLGQWDRPLFRWHRGDGGTIIAAAIYRSPGCRILFVWICGRELSWHLGCPGSHTGVGAWRW